MHSTKKKNVNLTPQKSVIRKKNCKVKYDNTQDKSILIKTIKHKYSLEF